MVEPEITFTDLAGITNLAEQLIKYVLNYVLENNKGELNYLEKHNQKELIERLKKIVAEDFQKIEYSQSIKILEKEQKRRAEKKQNSFIFRNIKWGMDLQSEHEKFLCEDYFNNRPLFVLNYPLEIKAFYMKNNPDGKTVAGFDCLFPEIGELIGGSLREDNYQLLKEKAYQKGLNTTNLNWYLDLRKSGYAPSGGFGLGLERLIMLITGTENIRDTLPFPRYPKHLEF